MERQELNELLSNIIYSYSLFQRELLDLRVDINNKEISPLLFRMLEQIHIEGNITVSTLSERLGVSMPNTSRNVNTLIKLGYANKKQDEADKRIIHLYLTQKGLDLIKDSIHQTQEKVIDKFNVLDPKEIEELSKAFDSIKKVFLRMRKLNNFNSDKAK